MADAEGDGAAPIRRIGLHEFRADMDGTLRQVGQGASFLVTSDGAVLAEIRPPAEALRPRRRPGALRGRIRMADDFDLLPPELLAAMEGKEG